MPVSSGVYKICRNGFLYQVKKEYGYHIAIKLGEYNMDFAVFNNTPLDGYELIADGFLKWDGCMNVSYHTEECMAHYCSCAGVYRFADVFREIYKLGLEHIDHAIYDAP